MDNIEHAYITFDPITHVFSVDAHTFDIDNLETREWLNQRIFAKDFEALQLYGSMCIDAGFALDHNYTSRYTPLHFESGDAAMAHIMLKAIQYLGEEGATTMLGMVNPDKLLKFAETTLKVKKITERTVWSVM